MTALQMEREALEHGIRAMRQGAGYAEASRRMMERMAVLAVCANRRAGPGDPRIRPASRPRPWQAAGLIMANERIGAVPGKRPRPILFDGRQWLGADESEKAFRRMAVEIDPAFGEGALNQILRRLADLAEEASECPRT